MSEYKVNEVLIPVKKKKLLNIENEFYQGPVENSQLWVHDFVCIFASNWLSNPNISENIYEKYEAKIQKRDFDLLPPIVFSFQFIDVLFQMINLQYEKTFLPDALTIIYSFYISDSKIELSPLKNIFIQMSSIFPRAQDDIKDQILKIFGGATDHSQDAHNFIINLFPVQLLNVLFNEKEDFSDSISLIINGYSKNENDPEQFLNILDLSINIFHRSLRIKNHNKAYVTERIPFQRSLDTILTICIKMSQNKNNLALEKLYGKNIDILLNQLLQDEINFREVRVLELIRFMYKNVKNLTNQNIFDLINSIEDEKPRLPRIEYSIFISFLNKSENYKEPIQSLILAHQIFKAQLSLLRNDESIFRYMEKKKLLNNFTEMIENGPFKLKTEITSSLSQIIEYFPPYLICQCFDFNLPISLINEIEYDTPNLTVLALKCLNYLILRANKLGLAIQSIIQYFFDNVDMCINDNEKVKDELLAFQAIVGSENNC